MDNSFIVTFEDNKLLKIFFLTKNESKAEELIKLYNDFDLYLCGENPNPYLS